MVRTYPYLTGGAASRTVMIFDLSGSMQTVSGGKSRLEEAKDRAEEILRGLPPGDLYGSASYFKFCKFIKHCPRAFAHGCVFGS